MAAPRLTVQMLMCSPVNETAEKYTRSLLEIEKNFDLCRISTWHTANWTLCFPFIVVYLVAIFAGHKYMKSRPPFQLRGALLFWNAALAIFSIFGTWRMLTSAVYNAEKYGFLATICRFDILEQRQAVAFRMFLFLLSKVIEFGDTVFIVLRKTPLLFLHWYHHVSVVFMVWSTGAYASPMQTYFTTFNFAVHSIMYSYYALKVLRIYIPKTVNIVITSFQLSQMVAGMIITGYAYLAKLDDPKCIVSEDALAIASSVYFSYFWLFLNFFYRAYVCKTAPQGLRNGQLKKLD